MPSASARPATRPQAAWRIDPDYRFPIDLTGLRRFNWQYKRRVQCSIDLGWGTPHRGLLQTRGIFLARPDRQFVTRKALDGEHVGVLPNVGVSYLVVAARLFDLGGLYIWGDGGSLSDHPCFVQILIPIPEYLAAALNYDWDEAAARTLFEWAVAQGDTYEGGRAFGTSGVVRIEASGRLAVEL